jgi:hypothetical protein
MTRQNQIVSGEIIMKIDLGEIVNAFKESYGKDILEREMIYNSKLKEVQELEEGFKKTYKREKFRMLKQLALIKKESKQRIGVLNET